MNIMTFHLFRSISCSYFFFPLPPSFPQPPSSNTSLATFPIHLNLSPPSLTPPNHRLTTTTTSSHSISCSRCSNRPPAADSPSSSQSCMKDVFVVVLDVCCRTRYAVILCVAAASFLLEEMRWEMWEKASSREEQGAACARKVDFWTVSGEETVQVGGGYAASCTAVRFSSGAEFVGCSNLPLAS